MSVTLVKFHDLLMSHFLSLIRRDEYLTRRLHFEERFLVKINFVKLSFFSSRINKALEVFSVVRFTEINLSSCLSLTNKYRDLQHT